MKKKRVEWRKYKEEEEEVEISVDFSAMCLQSLPNPTLNLASISKLNLSSNNLQSIPESLIARMVNVVELEVQSNELNSLPNSIGCLSKLKLLNASSNFLHTLPKTIQNCRSLEEVNLNFNKLGELPESLGFGLTNLKKLSVNSNKLAYLPQSISHLTSLCVLDARLNCLRSLPDDLENLIKLQVLNVSQNFRYLDTLPYSIGLLFSLIELDISYNNITSLPHSMGCLNKLQKLSIEGNPLARPPPEVFEGGLYAVKEFLRERMREDDNGRQKKKSWVGKLVKYGTFNGQMKRGPPFDHSEDFIIRDSRSINGVASPINMGMFHLFTFYHRGNQINREKYDRFFSRQG